MFMNNDVTPLLIKPYVKGVKQTPLDYIPGFFNLKELEVATMKLAAAVGEGIVPPLAHSTSICLQQSSVAI